MTDLLQALARRRNGLSAVPVDGNWLEIDCARDLEVASRHIKDGKLIR